MWLFDEEKPMTNKEVLIFVNEGSDDALRQFPAHVLNNTENMLHLIKNGYGYITLKYCAPELKKDVEFLKKAADHFHYVSQNEFFSLVHPELKNNKELLDVFAAKSNDPHVKVISKEHDQLFKSLKSTLNEKVKPKI